MKIISSSILNKVQLSLKCPMIQPKEIKKITHNCF
jgi:hypothetical protein